MKINILFCALAFLSLQEVYGSNTSSNDKKSTNFSSILPETLESRNAFKTLNILKSSSFEDIKKRYAYTFGKFKDIFHTLKGQEVENARAEMRALTENLDKAFSTTKYNNAWIDFKVSEGAVFPPVTNVLPETLESRNAFKTLNIPKSSSFEDIKKRYAYTFGKFKDIFHTLKGQEVENARAEMRALTENLDKAFSTTKYNNAWIDFKVSEGAVFPPKSELEKALEFFQLPKDATAAQIKNQFKNLSKLYHPDKGGKKEDFQKLLINYEILKKYNRVQ